MPIVWADGDGVAEGADPVAAGLVIAFSDVSIKARRALDRGRQSGGRQAGDAFAARLSGLGGVVRAV